MKIAAFEVHDFEEKDFSLAEKYGLKIEHSVEAPLQKSNLSFVNGCRGVTTLGKSILSRDLLAELKNRGVDFVATRTIGFNHIDIAAAKELGIRVGNARYDAYNVADFTVMLILMLLRKAKISVCRALVNDFSLDGLQGRELRSLTVGVVGAGRIGSAVIRNLSGFGCRILAYDPFLQEIGGAEKTDLPTLLRESDVVTLHVPLTDSNRHMIGGEAFQTMKRGALLINTARGDLVDTDALISALEEGTLGGAGIDTIENETDICHIDHRATVLDERKILYLKQFPNVIFTPHYGFFTQEATSQMVHCALECLSLFEKGDPNPYEI